jgi:hypothetical protein
VTLGREDGIADLTALIARLSELSGVDAGHFTGHGDVRDHSSHIEVDAEVADRVVAGVHGRPRVHPAPTTPPLAEGSPASSSAIVCEPAKSGPGGGRRRPGGRGRDRGDRGDRDRGPRRR